MSQTPVIAEEMRYEKKDQNVWKPGEDMGHDEVA